MEDYRSILAEYNQCRLQAEITEDKYKKPLYMHIVFWLINIAIITGITLYGFHYAKQRYDQILEVFLAVMLSFAFSLGLCGVWSLIQKIYYHFARKSAKKLIPEQEKQQQKLLQLKCQLIENLQRYKAEPSTRPHGNCANPPKLKRRWQEQEQILCETKLFEIQDQYERMSAKTIIWFLLAIGIGVGSIVLVIAIYLAIAIFIIVILFTMLSAYFSRNDDPRMYRSSWSSSTSSSQYEEPFFNSKNPQKEDPREKMKEIKKRTISKIAEIKKDLSLWGYAVSDIS